MPTSRTAQGRPFSIPQSCRPQHWVATRLSFAVMSATGYGRRKPEVQYYQLATGKLPINTCSKLASDLNDAKFQDSRAPHGAERSAAYRVPQMSHTRCTAIAARAGRGGGICRCVAARYFGRGALCSREIGPRLARGQSAALPHHQDQKHLPAMQISPQRREFCFCNLPLRQIIGR